jgi:hypothetical protein
MDSLAIRVPKNKIARELIKKSGLPIAASSANISGTISPTTAKHVLQNLPKNNVKILDGGKCKVGIESTIIDLTKKNIFLLRPGGLEISKIEKINKKCINDIINEFQKFQILDNLLRKNENNNKLKNVTNDLKRKLFTDK